MLKVNQAHSIKSWLELPTIFKVCPDISILSPMHAPPQAPAKQVIGVFHQNQLISEKYKPQFSARVNLVVKTKHNFSFRKVKYGAESFLKDQI